MAQYLIFLALAPVALAGSLSALLLPRIVHSYQRFAWLRFFNYLQLIFLVTNVAELLVRDPAIKHVLASLDYILLGSGPACWILFSLEYTGLVRHFRPGQAALFVLPAATGIAALLQGPSGLVWRDLQFPSVSWLLTMRSGGYGPLALTLFVYDYALLVAGAAILFRHTILSHKLYRRQTSWLLTGIALPLLCHFLYVSKLIPGWNKDFSSIAAAFGGFCFTVGCLRYRLFTVRPISSQMVLQQMRVGMIVVDPSDTIIDLNQAACAMLGKSEIALLGSPSAHVLSSVESRNFETTRHPLTSGDGRVEAWHIELREKGTAPISEPVASSSDNPVLSLGELRVVEMLALNLANKEISDRLGVSVNTVKFHLNNVYKKTGTRNRAELVHRISEIVNAKGN
jgi:DNA-binding CsgD family transcriptional regulator